MRVPFRIAAYIETLTQLFWQPLGELVEPDKSNKFMLAVNRKLKLLVKRLSRPGHGIYGTHHKASIKSSTDVASVDLAKTSKMPADFTKAAPPRLSSVNSAAAISKVWIEEGCITCGNSEAVCHEVFKIDVQRGTATVQPGIDLDRFKAKIKLAAASCPVKVIKYEVSHSRAAQPAR